MTPSTAVLALIADDDPADPILSIAFQRAEDHGAAVNALRYWPATADRALAARERWLFERLAFYQEQYPHLYATAESVNDTFQVAARAQAARLTVVGQGWLSHHGRWHEHEDGRSSGELTVVTGHPRSSAARPRPACA